MNTDYKKGQKVQLLDGTKRQGIITAVEPKKGFRGRYDYNDIYITLDDGEKVVHNDWHIKDFTIVQEKEA